MKRLIFYVSLLISTVIAFLLLTKPLVEIFSIDDRAGIVPMIISITIGHFITSYFFLKWNVLKSILKTIIYLIIVILLFSIITSIILFYYDKIAFLLNIIILISSWEISLFIINRNRKFCMFCSY